MGAEAGPRATNGHPAPPIGKSDEAISADDAVLTAMPVRASIDFGDVVATVHEKHPEFDPERIRAEVWALLARGALKLTREQRLVRS
jgi:hypothetical protein